MEVEVGSEELAYDLEPAPVIDLLDVAANQGFVLCRNNRLFLSGHAIAGSIPRRVRHDAIEYGQDATLWSVPPW